MKTKTTVTRVPVGRREEQYVVCRWCGHRYTRLGIARHWNKCEVRLKKECR